MPNDELYEVALNAIRDLFNDQTVSQAEAKRNLSSLIGEIETMISTLSDEEDE